MPLKSAPSYLTSCHLRPSPAQIFCISAASKPVSGSTSKGGSGKADATLSTPGVIVAQPSSPPHPIAVSGRSIAFAQREFQFDPRHAGEMAEHVGVEPLEVGQVAGDDLDEVVARSRHQVAGEHVGAVGEPALEGAERVVVLAFERDLDEGGDAEADGVRVYQRPVAGDDPAASRFWTRRVQAEATGRRGRRARPSAAARLRPGPPRSSGRTDPSA